MPNPTLTIPQKFAALEDAVRVDVLERNKEIHAAVVALVARKHFFMIGPPGTAKSFMIRRLVDRLDFGDDNEAYFQWLLTKYTTPEEVFGPPSLADLEQGHYRRNTAKKLPKSLVAFLDEIFKANSSILNALLTIMNERLFFNNGDTEEVPIASIFAASNEMPGDDNLWALWDRLHFRFEVKPIVDSGNFVKMLSTVREDVPAKVLTWDEVVVAQQEAAGVNLPNDIFEAMKMLRDNLAKEGVEPTERRFNESLGIIRAEAYLDGRDTADINDMRLLQHVMWSRTEDQKVVTRTVLDLANPTDKEAHELLERVETLEGELMKAIQTADNPKAVAKQAVEIHQKLHKAKQRMDDLQKRVKESGRKSDVLDDLERKFVEVAKVLMKDGFGMEGDPNV